VSAPDVGRLTRGKLIRYFEEAFTPRDRWQVGIEVEKMARDRTGAPLPYERDSDARTVRGLLERYLQLRGGAPVFEGDHLIGIDGESWGAISLEPAGQFEWSSRPARDLDRLDADLGAHLAALRTLSADLDVNWLDVAVEPERAVADMPWMPKARYGIMRSYLEPRGRLAHRMMTQTASVQCAVDFADADDWRRKFKAVATLTPVAVALFANSARADGRDTGWRSYRQAIWRETDPERCGLPPVVFGPGFGLDAWIEWATQVPMMFLRRARGLVPLGGVPFRELMTRTGCDALGTVDWELHLSGIFTEVRSYGYLEIRSADLLPDPLLASVPALWTGLLYSESALDDALALGAPLDDHAAWSAAMVEGARLGLDARAGGRPLRELARDLLAAAARGLRGGAACAGVSADPARRLAPLALRHGLDPP